MYRILVCDDEKEIADALEIYLTNEGYEVLKAHDGIEALEIIEKEEIHLIIMDVMMPRMDGMRATLKIREKKNIPILMLSAKSEDYDKILGLNVGADDYITKPFNPVELLARVRSQLRRYTTLGGGNFSSSTISVAGIIIDDNGKTVTVDGKEVNLTPKEYEILKLLASTPGKVFSPTDIYRHIWKDEPYGADATVAVHIRHLREKIEINPKEPRYLKVVWGVGYKID